VNIGENTGYARLLGRVSDVKRGGDYPEGYWFEIITSGVWNLYAGGQKIGSGRSPFPPFVWNKVAISFKGNLVSVRVNDKEVVSLTDKRYTHGQAGIGSDFNTVEFDNFEVE